MLQMKKQRLERNGVRSLRRLQSLQQLVKRLVVLDSILVPAAEIADDLAEHALEADVLQLIEDVISNVQQTVGI